MTKGKNIIFSGELDSIIDLIYKEDNPLIKSISIMEKEEGMNNKDMINYRKVENAYYSENGLNIVYADDPNNPVNMNGYGYNKVITGFWIWLELDIDYITKKYNDYI